MPLTIEDSDEDKESEQDDDETDMESDLEGKRNDGNLLGNFDHVYFGL